MNLVRCAPVARIYERDDAITFVAPDGIARRLEGDSAALARAVLTFATIARSRADVRAHIAELSGGAVAEGGVVDEAIDLLLDCDALEPVTEREPSRPALAPRQRVVLALTGGVGSMYAPLLIEQLQRRAFDVRVAATPNALRFVSALALEALTHAPVVASMWPADARSPVPHLELAKWADFVLLCPATATSIARLAGGSCATVPSALAISARVPVIVVPSMNERMFSAPSVQRNLEQLKHDGFLVVRPSVGYEVADAPRGRAPMCSTAPPAAAIVDIVAAVAAEQLRPPADMDAAAWDSLYASTPLEALPWFTDTIDADVARALETFAPRCGRFLDVGTGGGSVAIAAARRGFGVVASDVSPRALEAAQQRAGTLPIAWIVDDVSDSRLVGRFDIVHDRGCLHTLAPARRSGWARTVTRLTASGGLALVKEHSPTAPSAIATHRFRADDIARLLEEFELLRAEASTVPGPSGAPEAVFCVLRRR